MDSNPSQEKSFFPLKTNVARTYVFKTNVQRNLVLVLTNVLLLTNFVRTIVIALTNFVRTNMVVLTNSFRLMF